MKLTGAQILIQSLIDLGVEVVFGYPGGQVLPIYDALYEKRDKIKHILTSGEQGAAFAADGYARSTKNAGVCIATSGPGATNLVTGIASAHMDSVPLIAITGNVSLNLIGRDAFQEIDITGVTIPITKHSYMVKDVNKLAEIINEAFTIATSDRPGPVLIDIPKDIQLKTAEYTKVIKNPIRSVEVDPEEIGLAVKMIDEAKKPLLYCGGGVVFSDASKELLNFIEKTDCPAVFSMMGLTALSKNHPKNLGMAGIHGSLSAAKAINNCDLLIAIGTRFSERMVKDEAGFLRQAKTIHIDIDNSEHGKNLNCGLYIKGDAKNVLRILSKKSKKKENIEWNGYLLKFKENDDYLKTGKKAKLSMLNAVKAASSVLDDDTIVTTDVGQHQVITAQYYNFIKPRKFLCSCGLGAMGYGMGAAIGAKTGNKDKTVLLITGDGSFHMNFNEIACAVSEKLPIIILVFNNSVLGLVRQLQTAFYDKHYSSTDLNRKTDYVKLSEALGAGGTRVDNVDDLKKAIVFAKSYKKP